MGARHVREANPDPGCSPETCATEDKNVARGSQKQRVTTLAVSLVMSKGAANGPKEDESDSEDEIWETDEEEEQDLGLGDIKSKAAEGSMDKKPFGASGSALGTLPPLSSALSPLKVAPQFLPAHSVRFDAFGGDTTGNPTFSYRTPLHRFIIPPYTPR